MSSNNINQTIKTLNIMIWIYFITRLDIIIGLSWAVVIASLIILFISFMMYVSEDDNMAKKLMKIVCPFFIVATLLLVFLPTTKEACLIYAGGKTIEYIQNNDEITETPDKVIKLTNTYLDYLTEKMEEPKEPQSEE